MSPSPFYAIEAFLLHALLLRTDLRLESSLFCRFHPTVILEVWTSWYIVRGTQLPEGKVLVVLVTFDGYMSRHELHGDYLGLFCVCFKAVGGDTCRSQREAAEVPCLPTGVSEKYLHQ